MADLRRFIPAVAALALLLSACTDDGPTSPGGGSAGRTIPVLSIGGGADEMGFIARETPDGGYLIVGSIGKPSLFFSDIYAVWTDATGAVLGSYPVRRGETSCGIHASVPTPDGGVVAITRRDSEAILMKFAPDGAIAWERDYGSHAGSSLYSLCTAGAGFLITVVTDAFADLTTIEFIFTNADGTLRSSAAWEWVPRRIYSTAETDDGSFILAGAQRITATNWDIFVARTKPGSITEDWANTYGTANNDYADHTVALNDDAVLSGIMDDSPDILNDGYYYVMRLRSDGRESWTRDVSTLGYMSDLAPTRDGGLVVAANGSDDGAKIALLNGSGSVLWERKVTGGLDGETVRSVVAEKDGYVITGTTRTGPGADLDILLARTNLWGYGYPFPPHEPECIQPVTPPPPSNIVGTQRSYSVVHDTGRGMHAIWALTSDFVVAVGDSGYITRFDGDSWSRMTSNTDEELYDVYGFAADDVFVAARRGKIFHYDGVSWEEMPSTATYLSSLWGASPDDVWAGGVQLMHYDGARWTDETPKGWKTPIDMDGITATDIYSVGAAGEVQQFDGCTWSTVYVAPDRLYGVSAIPGPLVHGVGDNGLVVRYSQGSWQTFTLPTGQDLTSAWARSRNDVFVAGTAGFAGPYLLYWFNGTSWVQQSTASTQALLDVTGTADGHIFGATSYADIVHGTP